MMEDWFGKLPPISAGAREAIVNITPWIALIFGILGILASLAGFGILTAFSPFMMLGGGVSYAGMSIIQAVIGLIGSVLLLMAFPGTRARKRKGWDLLFYSQAVDILSAIIAVSLTGIVFSLVAFYLLFQIKSYYK